METRAEEKAPPGQGSIERRLQARYPTNDSAEVKVLPGLNPRVDAWLMEASPSAVHLWLKTVIEIDAAIKIRVRSHKVILRKVRYCRLGGADFNASVFIQDTTCSRKARNLHIKDDELSLYPVAKTLTVSEIRLKSYLGHCGSHDLRLAETNATLFAMRKRGDH